MYDTMNLRNMEIHYNIVDNNLLQSSEADEFYMNNRDLELTKELWRKLHHTPELSGQETKTKSILKEYLTNYTTLSVVETPDYLYTVYEEKDCEQPQLTICLRADMDAIPDGEGGVFHGCGHDGHSAALFLAALCLERLRQKGKKIGKRVILLWQQAEETGEGARRACPVLLKESVSEIYGCHNIPGYPLGEVLLRRQVFACASKGLILDLHGKQSHAAYPEQGINPGYLIAEIVNKLPIWCEDHKKGLTMASIIEMKVGSENFGISAGDGRLCLTLRAHYQEDLEILTEAILAYARQQAATSGITMEVSETDAFPDTVNDTALTEKLEQLCIDHALSYTYLPEPMRWSEDFGWYQKKCRGVFFGIGAGEETPGLHTESYCYPEALLEKAGMIWETIIMH